MSLPPREVVRRLNQQAHDIEDAYQLLTDLRIETAAGFARVDERLDGVDTRLDGMDGRLESMDTRLDGMDTQLQGHGQLLERILHLLEKPVT